MKSSIGIGDLPIAPYILERLMFHATSCLQNHLSNPKQVALHQLCCVAALRIQSAVRKHCPLSAKKQQCSRVVIPNNLSQVRQLPPSTLIIKYLPIICGAKLPSNLDRVPQQDTAWVHMQYKYSSNVRV